MENGCLKSSKRGEGQWICARARGKGKAGIWPLLCSPLKTRTENKAGAPDTAFGASSFKRLRVGLAATGNGEIKKQQHLKHGCDPGGGGFLGAPPQTQAHTGNVPLGLGVWGLLKDPLG